MGRPFSSLMVLAVAILTACPAVTVGSPDAFVPGEVLVRVRERSVAERQAIAASVDGTIVESSRAIAFDRLRLPADRPVAEVVARLRQDPRVVWAEPNFRYQGFDLTCTPQDPDLRDDPLDPDTQWGAFLTGLPALWRTQGCADSMATIAIIDSGIDSLPAHPDLMENVLSGGYDFVDGDEVPIDWGVNRGHGTHVAGIAAASANDIGIAGAAPQANLLIVRVLDCNDPEGCVGSSSDIALGIEYAVDEGARVLNLSLGSGALSEAIRSAVFYALENQVVVVAASGNDGAPSVSYPAAIPEVIAVGASNSSDEVADFSNWGPELDVVAPGEDIWSTVPGGGWDLSSGTSMAAPFVAGIAAILVSRTPSIRPSEVQSWVRMHTIDLPGTSDGFGRVDFGSLEDWSDAGGSYPAASHGSHFWEWLGRDASAEVSETDPDDMDGRPNRGGDHDVDGADDGMFPLSFSHLPFLPPRLDGGAAAVDVTLSVGDAAGPRYGPVYAKSLHLDAWFDWNSDETFATDATEHEIVDHMEDPSSWGANTKTVSIGIAPPDEHFKGNPVVVRTRLAYGDTAADPDGATDFGEVEDVSFINYVEDFDISMHTVDPAPFMDPMGWFISPDPNPSTGCENHGEWEMASVPHPNMLNIPCNGVVEFARGMHTPVMDWSEYTDARLRFFYCHEVQECSPFADYCRVVIAACGVVMDVAPIPIGSGTTEIDLSAYAGCDDIQLLFIEETDWAGRLSVDDVVIWAWDDSAPEVVTDLLASATGAPAEASLTWTSVSENLVATTSEARANSVQIRYDDGPITDEAGWSAAALLRPEDVVAGAGLPIPGAPADGRSVAFAMPSAFGTYHFAARVGDEVVHLSGLSANESITLDPMAAVSVLGQEDATAFPGTDIELSFDIENTGSVADLYRLEASSALSWVTTAEHDYVTLAPGEQLTSTVTVSVPSDASDGEIDDVELIAYSVGAGSVSDADQVSVTVSGSVSVGPAHDVPESYFRVGQNPFEARARFELGLRVPGKVSVSVHDASGRLVRTLETGALAAGRHAVEWDGRDRGGRSMASGVYWVRVEGPELQTSRRILRVK